MGWTETQPGARCPRRGGAGGRARRVPGARRSAVPPPHRAPQLQQAGAQRGPRPVACVWERACGRGSSRRRGGRVCSGEACERSRRAGPTDRHSDRQPLRHPARRPGPLRAAALRGGRRGWQCLRAHARSQTHTPGPRHRHTTRTDPRPAAAHTRTRAHARSPAQAPQQPLPGGGGILLGFQPGLEVSEFLRTRELPAAGGDPGNPS